MLAGLLLIALGAALYQLPPSQPSSEPSPRGGVSVEGRVLVYVNEELKASAPMNSFLRGATPLLALGLFPTSGFRYAHINFYNENPSTWGVYLDAGTWNIQYHYGGAASGDSVWGMYQQITPLVFVLDGTGAKWAEIALSTTPSFASNATGVLVTVTGSVAPSITEAKEVAKLRFIRPLGLYSTTGWPADAAFRLTEDVIDPPVTVNPGDTLTVAYQFYFKSDQVFTENWARAFFAWLYNVPAAKIEVTATDGSTTYVDPYAPSNTAPANNAPVNSYIVVGNGSATFSRTAYKVVSEVARAEPSVQVYGGGIALSYSFIFERDTTVTELAVYVKLRNGKEVMVFYYVLPQPVQAKAYVPFSVTFRLNLPWEDRV